MILTYKIKHSRDFSSELSAARSVAEYALKYRTISSKDVSQFGLKSIISNQILRKYSRNHKAKKVKNVKLTIPNQGISVDKTNQTIYIPSLKLRLNYRFQDFIKVNQIELDNTYAYVSISAAEPPKQDIQGYLGIDLNETAHCAVISNPITGKVLKLGKKAQHTHLKYKSIREKLQKKKAYRQLKQVKNRESRIVRDLNHKISRTIVQEAVKNNCGIKLEDLSGIRRKTRNIKDTTKRYSLNSWAFYQLKSFIKYKALLQGIPVEEVNPFNTSQTCSKCGELGNRKGKSFRCPHCGHLDHADANAGFNIAKASVIVNCAAKERRAKGTLMSLESSGIDDVVFHLI
jgi:putative transposase